MIYTWHALHWFYNWSAQYWVYPIYLVCIALVFSCIIGLYILGCLADAIGCSLHSICPMLVKIHVYIIYLICLMLILSPIKCSLGLTNSGLSGFMLCNYDPSNADFLLEYILICIFSRAGTPARVVCGYPCGSSRHLFPSVLF